MTFETVFIATLLGAHLTIEFELLKAFGLHAVGYVLGTALFSFRHGCGLFSDAVVVAKVLQRCGEGIK